MKEKVLKTWTKFVDIITVIWLGIFIIGFFLTGKLSEVCFYLNVVILSVFMADLFVSYKSSKNNWHIFLKEHWFDVLMIIPYFRIFRPLRAFRILRVVKGIKIVRRLIKFSKILMRWISGKSN